ncbi:hypothetical protein [Aliikangiella maris]|uniref:Uncharacterized protein n=2 Tax=Aliikangiella maris TaxID=3162458 RepID=A0ABV2C028_9GAMM
MAEMELEGLAASPELQQLSESDLKRLNSDLAGIRSKKEGPQGYQYALIANQSGMYKCHTCESGFRFLNEGDVWKYGETTTKRYSGPQLAFKEAGLPLTEVPQFFGTRRQIKIAEKLKIYSHLARYKELPAGNRIRR